MALQVVPMLPCADIDEIEAFFVPLGFEVTYRQVRPNPYLALEGHGFPVHYYGMPAHRAEDSHSTFGVAVPDPGPLFEAFAAGLRAQFGKLPVSGLPRITRPRPRKNAGGLSGFSLVDPAGNWIRVMSSGAPSAQEASSPLRRSLLDAIVLADSKDDVAQAAKVLGGAVRRAAPDDPALADARAFLDELTERLA